MATQMKLLVCVAVLVCLLESSSCETKKKLLVKVPHVVKHIHLTHYEPVHVHNIQHQKTNHHHKHEKTVPVGEPGWESRSQERPRLPLTSGTEESEDHLKNSYEYGRDSFWNGGSDVGSAKGQVKRRRQPYREDSLKEPITHANEETPVWMSRALGDNRDEWMMSEEHRSGIREQHGYRGGEEPLDSGHNNNGHATSWRSNQEGGWRPVMDYGNWDDERMSRGREQANYENQYSYSREAVDGEYTDYRQTEEKPRKKGQKKDEQKSKWSKQIKQGELINEEDVQRIINSLQLGKYQHEQIEKEQEFHQHQALEQNRPTVQQPQLLSHHQQVQQAAQQASYRAHIPIVNPIPPQVQTQYTPQQKPSSWSPPIQQKRPEGQWTSPQTPLTTHSPKMVWSGLHLQLPQTTMWHVQQHDVGSTSGLPVQVISSHSNSVSTLRPPAQHQHTASEPLRHLVMSAQAQTLDSDLLRPHVMPAHPQTLASDLLRSHVMPAQRQTLASDLLRPHVMPTQPQTIASDPLRPHAMPIQPQTLASEHLRHHQLPPAGWPMDQRSPGVKQTWQQSVQTSGRDGPASSYKVEVINYLDSKRA